MSVTGSNSASMQEKLRRTDDFFTGERKIIIIYSPSNKSYDIEHFIADTD